MTEVALSTQKANLFCRMVSTRSATAGAMQCRSQRERSSNGRLAAQLLFFDVYLGTSAVRCER
eukprot:463051-Amphidinium_carterae.1